MGFVFRARSTQFNNAPLGNHVARLVAVVDLGVQEVQYNGELRDTPQVYLVWCLLSCDPNKDGTQPMIGKVYTQSLHNKSGLRPVVDVLAGRHVMDGDEIDIRDYLGTPSLVHVEEKSGYTRVGSVTPLPKGVSVPAQPVPSYSSDWREIAILNPGQVPAWVPPIFGVSVEDVCKVAKGESTPETSEAPPF